VIPMYPASGTVATNATLFSANLSEAIPDMLTKNEGNRNHTVK